MSLMLVPFGLARLISQRRSRLWKWVALIVAAVFTFVIIIAAVSVNQLAIGVTCGVGALILVRTAYRGLSDNCEYAGHKRSLIAFYTICVPVILVTFRATVLPHAAEWSRVRAIAHSATLIAEIELFRQRRGYHPISLQSLNRVVLTGVVGIERFHYEPNGDAYNVFFVRPHIELDAKELVMFNPRDEHRFASHELDLLQYDGEHLEQRRGDRRRIQMGHPHWVSILFD